MRKIHTNRQEGKTTEIRPIPRAFPEEMPVLFVAIPCLVGNSGLQLGARHATVAVQRFGWSFHFDTGVCLFS